MPQIRISSWVTQMREKTHYMKDRAPFKYGTHQIWDYNSTKALLS